MKSTIVEPRGGPGGKAATAPSGPPRPHVAAFHGLRATACIGVVAIHAITVTLGYRGHPAVLTGLQAGQLLLMFSTPAFVFLAAAQAAYAYQRPPPGFLRRRVRYILVPYIAINIAYAAFHALISARGHNDFELLIREWSTGSVVNLMGGSHLWFIIPIFQFYLLFPLFTRWSRRRLRLVLVSSLVLNVAYLLAFAFGPRLENPYSALVGRHWYSHFFPAWIFYFALGTAIGRYLGEARKRLERYVPFFVLGALLSAGLLLFAQFSGLLTDTSSRRPDVLLYAAFVIPVLLHAAFRLREIPPLLIRISERSFGIYLLHPFVLELLWRGLPLQRLPVAALGIGLLITGLALSYLATESLRRVPGGSLLIGRVRTG